MKAQFVIFAVLAAAIAAPGQTINPELPDAPAPRNHSFFDPVNVAGFAAAGVAISLDSLSTQNMLSAGITEGNRIAAPFVGTRGNPNGSGQVFISSLGFASTIGGAYLMHRFEGRARNHPHARKLFSALERATPSIVAGIEFQRWKHNTDLIAQIPKSR